MTHPAGWYPDPATPSIQRYWDGQQWSQHTQPAPTAISAKKRRGPVRTILTIAGVFLLIIVAISFCSTSSDNNSSTTATTTADPDFTNPATYTELDDRALQVLIKDPEAAKGDKRIIYGEVTQLDAATGNQSMRINAIATPDFDSYGDNVVVNVRDPELLKPVLSGDQVKLFVTVEGAISYDTQIGGSTTVPEFTAAIVEVLPSQ